MFLYEFLQVCKTVDWGHYIFVIFIKYLSMPTKNSRICQSCKMILLRIYCD